jgi:hypothetical protein
VCVARSASSAVSNCEISSLCDSRSKLLTKSSYASMSSGSLRSTFESSLLALHSGDQRPLAHWCMRTVVGCWLLLVAVADTYAAADVLLSTVDEAEGDSPPEYSSKNDDIPESQKQCQHPAGREACAIGSDQASKQARSIDILDVSAVNEKPLVLLRCCSCWCC